MNKEIITKKQGTYLLVIFTIGTSLILSGGTKARQDTWISSLIAITAIFPMLLIYGRIQKNYPQKHLFEILDIIFGKILGRIFSVLYIWYFLHLSAICIRNITEFIQVVSFQETPQFVPSIFITLLIIYMIKSGFDVFGRWSTFILPFVFTLLIIVGILSVTEFKYENIKPILYFGWSPVFDGALSIFSFPFGEIVVFLSIFHKIKESKKIYNIYILGTLISASMIFFTIIKNTFALGYPLAQTNYFPSYYANMIISIGFLQRIEAITSIVLVLCGFAKACVCIFAVCIGISHLLNFSEYKDIAVPISFLAAILAMILYSSTMEMFEFVEVYKYYALPFQVFFPILMLIVGIFRKKGGITSLQSKYN